MDSVNALMFRKNFGKILDRVAKKKEAILVKRMNEPLVVMEPYETYIAHQTESSRQMKILKAKELIQAWALRNVSKLKGLNSAGVIRKMRDER